MLWLQYKTRVIAELAGVLLSLFYVWNVANMFEELDGKRSIVIHHDKPHIHFFKLINVALMIEYSIFSITAGLMVEILFMLFSVYKAT